MDTITIQQVITWGIPILIASVGATFAITKYNNANARRVLEDRLKLKEDKIKEYAVRLSESQHSADSPLKHSPVREMNRQLNGKETSDLTNQIDALEAERDRLLSELSNRATASLDPRSELSNLLSQLKSADKETRNKAVQGLFALKDPLSFIPLVNYLENHTDEATKGSNVYLGAWFTALIQIGGPKGAEYIASHTESTRQSWSEAAFSNLQYTLSTPELIDGAIPALERCALTHPSTFTRTQAKVLIQHLQSKRREYVDRANALKEQERLIEEQAKKHDVKPMAYIRTFGVAGADPTLTYPAVPIAVNKALGKAGLRIEQMELIEIQEAFAAQVLADAKLMGLTQSDMDKRVNVNGSGISLGHPIGASGLRMIYEIYHQLQDKAGSRQVKDAKLGLIHNIGGWPGAFTSAVAVFGRSE